VEAVEASQCLPARVQAGFRRKPLIAALDRLAAGTSPIGLVLGSGFECDPRMLAHLGEHFRLIGNPPDVVRRAKDPTAFFGALTKLGIRHPETQLVPPAAGDGWLMKRIGGSGGLHIHACPPAPRLDPRRYFQRRVDGEPLSVLAVIGRTGPVFAFTRQWCAPLPRRPYRYGGATGPITPEPDLEARLIDISRATAESLGLIGLVSLDFLIDDGEPILIEVNPRPGASLDVLDDAEGNLFRSHVEASRGGDAAGLLLARWQPPKARAAAYLYADRGPIEIAPGLDWPHWTADRPQPGSRILKHQPLATVLADSASPDEAERLCRHRLGLLENLLYESANGKGTPT